MDITIIRHLPTHWNQKGILQGKRDIPISLPLSNNSVNKLRENKLRLHQHQSFDYVFASELVRTIQTAKLYGYMAPTIEPLLNELDFGQFEGKAKEDLRKAHKEWITSPLQMTLGESLKNFQQRIYTFIEKYAHAHSLLVFGHGSWARALVSIKNIGTIQKMNQIEINNNELITVKIKKRYETNLKDSESLVDRQNQ